jgi:PAS domain S-box-containing protein
LNHTKGVNSSSERAEFALELMQTGPVVILQHKGLLRKLIYLSGNFQTVFSLDPEPFLSGREYIESRIHESDRHHWHSMSDLTMENTATRTLSGRFRLQDGHGKWRVVDHQTIVDGGEPGREASTLAYWIDRTRETETLWRLELTLEGARVGTWDCSLESGAVTVDSQWAHLLGLRLDDLEGFSLVAWRARLHPSDRAQWDHLTDIITSGKETSLNLHARFRHQTGRWIWCRIRGKVFETSTEGRPLRVLGTQEDISELMEAQEERTLLARVRQSTVLDPHGVFS